MNDFVKRLNILVEKCNCTALTIKQHKDSIIRDALIAGLHSDVIRARLLELNDSEASLSDCIARANAVKISTDFSKSFQNSFSVGTPTLNAVQSVQPGPVVAATKQCNSSSQKHSHYDKCRFCGEAPHPRQKCPARNTNCLKCGKSGHWARVCQARVAACQSTVAHGMLCTIQPDASSVYYPVKINGKETLLALIDPGSTESFITAASAERLKLKTQNANYHIKLANGNDYHIDAHADVSVSIESEKYDVSLLVAGSLVCDVIIGMDILSQHKSITLHLGGPRNDLTLQSHCCATFTQMNVEAPPLFADLEKINPVPIKTNHCSCSNNDNHFIREEVQRLLEHNIIDESFSPWRSQAFVVRKGKP